MNKKDLIIVCGEEYNQGTKTWLKKLFFQDSSRGGMFILFLSMFIIAIDFGFYHLYAEYQIIKSALIFFIAWTIVALIRYPFYRNYKIKEDNLNSKDIEKKYQELLKKRLKQHSSIVLGIYFAFWFLFVFVGFIKSVFEYGFGFNEFLGAIFLTILFGTLYLSQLDNRKQLISQIQFKNQAKK